MGFSGSRRPARASLIEDDSASIALILAEHHALQGLLEILQHLGIVLGDVLGRDPGDLGDDGLDLLGADGLPALRIRHEMLGRARLVDHVDRLVGQLAVVDVARRELDGGLDRVRGVLDVVVILEIGLEALQDLHAVFHRRLVHVDLLEPAAERAVLLEVLAEFLVGGRAHAAELAALERGLEEVRGVHGAARCGARADHGVDFVDEENRVGVCFELGYDGLEALFEVAAVARAGEKGPHVEREDRRARQHLGYLTLYDLPRKALGDGGLANARVAYEKRVVLAAAAEHLDAALDLVFAADERIHVALAGLGIEVDAVLGERRFLGVAFLGLGLFLEILRALDGAAFTEARVLGDAVGDEVHRVVARHVLLLQEIGGVRLAFGEDRDEHVGAGDLGAARGLHVDRGALDHPLERRCRNRLGALDIGHESRKIILDEVEKGLSERFEIDGTGLHHLCGLGFVDQCEKQMLQSGQFMAPGIGERQSGMDRILERF